MDKLSFYDIDKEYIYYLQQEEIKQRGFTKVPNVEYKNDKKIPVPEAAITERIINNESNPSRRVFLQKQLDYISSNRDSIQNRAKRTYLRIINNYNPQLTKNSCDFKLLEEKCLEFEKEKP